MAEPVNKYTAIVDPGYSEAERRQIAIEIINFIQDRTRAGQGIGGKTFRNSAGQPRYSENYTETREFKIAGKNAADINLSLTGDMVDSVDIIDVSSIGQVVIGFESGPENDKSVWVRRKGYDFLGLTPNELQGILKRFGPPRTKNQPLDINESLVQSLVRGFFGR